MPKESLPLEWLSMIAVGEIFDRDVVLSDIDRRRRGSGEDLCSGQSADKSSSTVLYLALNET